MLQPSVQAAPQPDPVRGSLYKCDGQGALFPQDGKTLPTIPHNARRVKSNAFQHGSADAADALCRSGCQSRLRETGG